MSRMAPRRLDPHNIESALPPSGRILVGSCSGESLLLAEAMKRAGERLGATTFTGIFVPGLNRRTYLANAECRVETFFLTPELKAAGSAVKFIPLCYADIPRPSRMMARHQFSLRLPLEAQNLRKRRGRCEAAARSVSQGSRP
jgi:hypothetical protein